MTADERLANPAGVLQGGLLGAFADSAMGASAVTYARAELAGRKIFCANVEMKVSFLRPVPAGSTLTCVATVVSGGERVVFCEAEVRDDSDRLVGKASSTYVITPRDGEPRD
jgi:uncharacterized protein (TIGR00369 family)